MTYLTPQKRNTSKEKKKTNKKYPYKTGGRHRTMTKTQTKKIPKKCPVCDSTRIRGDTNKFQCKGCQYTWKSQGEITK